MGLDLLVKNGTVVDGSGAVRYGADIGVKDGLISEIGRIRETAERTINADGLVVAPGFIDGHTHMDAQVSWDSTGSCSCWHGVTTVLMGNCGFALAPCAPSDREWFARCLEAVEDIPAEVMMAGIDWNWETFPEYLANVERLPKGLNYGAYIGHSALRMYAMGERALTEAANEDDLESMARAIREALSAGAIGFSTSRATTHVTPDGTPVPSRIAEWEEIDRLVASMTEVNAGVFQIGPDMSSGLAQQDFLDRLRKITLQSGRPVMFGLLSTGQGDDPISWEYQTNYIEEVVGSGGRMWGQATTRSINAIFSAKSYLPFDDLPNWKKVRSLSLKEQKVQFSNPDVRKLLISDETLMKPRDKVFQGGGAATTDPRKPDYGNLYVMQGVDWNDPTVESLARSRSQHPVEVILDSVVKNENQMFIQPLVNEEPAHVLGILQHPRTLATFSDSGAHVCQEMGSSLQTHMLNYWVRQKQAFTLENAVKMLTLDNALAWDIVGRGLIRENYAADLVLFEESRIRPQLPKVHHDLPGGAPRLVQKSEGIAYTVVNGQVTLENGCATGEHSGQMVKGRLASTH